MDTGAIEVRPCTLDKTLLHHFDTPNGEPRMTYVRLNEARQVTVLIQFLRADPYEGQPCFDAAWAVPTEFRGKGRACEAFLAAVRELRHSVPRGKAFYVEAVVGVDKVASRKTAERAFGSPGIPGIDSNSGEPILQFVRLIEEASDLRNP